VDDVLEELDRQFFIHWILERELERDGQHVEAEHRHPAGAIDILFQETVSFRVGL